jgi:nicotinate-nucleotide adenylyltransferase
VNAVSSTACLPTRIGLLGGTFDPFHHGHLALARHFGQQLQLTHLVLIPAGQPWQKSSLATAACHRLAMTRLAATRLALPPTTTIVVATDEIARPGPSYTIETLKTWHARIDAHTSLSLLIGADQLLQLESWQRWRALFDYAHLCVAARPGYQLSAAPAAIAAEISQRTASKEALCAQSHGLMLIDTTLAINLCATDVRRWIKQQGVTRNTSPPPFLPGAIWRYICSHHLYQN